MVIVGHADSHEKSPEQIGKQRAEAVKDYLVQAGVEGSRIGTRSAAASKPLDTGEQAMAMARNRRVEVWFVPDNEPGIESRVLPVYYVPADSVDVRIRIVVRRRRR